MRGKEELQSGIYGPSSPYGNGLYAFNLETNAGRSSAANGLNHMDDHHHHHRHNYYNKTSSTTLPPPPVAYSISKSNNKNNRQSWEINERESKRQRRVAKYNIYTVESKMKSSIRNSFRWFKSKLLG